MENANVDIRDLKQRETAYTIPTHYGRDVFMKVCIVKFGNVNPTITLVPIL
jgi:hypothetical protein